MELLRLLFSDMNLLQSELQFCVLYCVLFTGIRTTNIRRHVTVI